MKVSAYIVTLAALGALALPAAVQAQAGSDRDVRCVIVSNVFSQASKDVPRKQLAAAVGLYFLGRSDSRLPGPQLKAAILKEQKLLVGKNPGEIMTACAQAFQARQKTLQAMGQDIARSQPKK